MRSALPDIAAEAARNTPLPAPQQPAESSKRHSSSLSAIAAQLLGPTPPPMSAHNHFMATTLDMSFTPSPEAIASFSVVAEQCK